ncbi:MAG: hypothetical protein Q8K07_07855, partial [Methylicorpusculum sp.]|nr:hypothetical protein [Methylicorpusculum sp.]
DWEKPFEERRKPFHGGLTAASLLPTSSKSFPQPFFPFKLRIAEPTVSFRQGLPKSRIPV